MTNRIAEVFGTSPVLLPVVHPIGWHQALGAVRVAHDLGIRGVFFIDQGMRESDVLALVRTIRAQYPSLWIGLNLLSRSPSDALAIALDECGQIDGIWSDRAGIDERSADQPEAALFADARRALVWNGLYFGGVAFKYQREVMSEDLPRAAEIAVPFMDVVCTSGPGTGYPVAVDKVRRLRAGLGDHAMGLASGVTAKNVQIYLPYVQAFLVGTGIEHSLGVFDPAKIEDLLRAMRSSPMIDAGEGRL